MSLGARLLARGVALAVAACRGAAPSSPPAPPPPPAATEPAPAAEAGAQDLASPAGLAASTQPAPAGAFWEAAGLTVPRLGQEELRRRFAPFPKATTPIVGMGEETVAHRLPMTLAYFETLASPVDVLEFYAYEFDRRGWSWTGLDDTSQAVPYPALSGTDPASYLQLSVIVMPNGKGEPNTVILGIADMRPEARVLDEGELPTYPGAAPLTVRTTELGSTSYTQVFTAPDAPDRVASYYRERMSALGYREVREGEAQPGLSFVKGDRRWNLALQPREGKQTFVTAISTLGQEAAP